VQRLRHAVQNALAETRPLAFVNDKGLWDLATPSLSGAVRAGPVCPVAFLGQVRVPALGTEIGASHGMLRKASYSCSFSANPTWFPSTRASRTLSSR
jgi:hypothetical protein